MVDGRVNRDSTGLEVRYPVILSPAEKEISRKITVAFRQFVCGFDILRVQGRSYVCDVNGWSFVKNSRKYYDDCSQVLTDYMLRMLRPAHTVRAKAPIAINTGDSPKLLQSGGIQLRGRSGSISKDKNAPLSSSFPSIAATGESPAGGLVADGETQSLRIDALLTHKSSDKDEDRFLLPSFFYISLSDLLTYCSALNK